MDCPCNKKEKGLGTATVVEMPVFFRLVRVTAAQGDEESFPPAVGLYRNVILNYEVNNHSYIYSSDGIPVLITGRDGSAGSLDFDNLTNRPKYAGTTISSSTNIPEVPSVISDNDFNNLWTEE